MVVSSAIVCDHDCRVADDRRSMFPYDRRRSQTLLRSAICDPRSYGKQPLCSIFCDRLRSSAIVIAGSQTIAEVCFHMIADDRRSYCDLRSANSDHMETSLNCHRYLRFGDLGLLRLVGFLQDIFVVSVYYLF